MSVIEISQLKKHFGDTKAVDNNTLKVEKGEVFGFLGPNGAGKTTAFNLISGFYTPDEGDVFLKGKSIAGLSPEAIVVDSAHPDRLLLLSDDGGRRMGGRECKDQDEGRKFFRSVVVPLPER